jgi:hypothetical protein
MTAEQQAFLMQLMARGDPRTGAGAPAAPPTSLPPLGSGPPPGLGHPGAYVPPSSVWGGAVSAPGYAYPPPGMGGAFRGSSLPATSTGAPGRFEASMMPYAVVVPMVSASVGRVSARELRAGEGHGEREEDRVALALPLPERGFLMDPSLLGVRLTANTFACAPGQPIKVDCFGDGPSSGMDVCGMFTANSFSVDNPIGRREWPVPSRGNLRESHSYSRYFQFHAPRGPGVFEFRLFDGGEHGGEPLSELLMIGRGAMVRVEVQGDMLPQYLESMMSTLQEARESLEGCCTTAETLTREIVRVAAAAGSTVEAPTSEGVAAIEGDMKLSLALDDAIGAAVPRAVHRLCRAVESVARVLARVRVGPSRPHPDVVIKCLHSSWGALEFVESAMERLTSCGASVRAIARAGGTDQGSAEEDQEADEGRGGASSPLTSYSQQLSAGVSIWRNRDQSSVHVAVRNILASVFRRHYLVHSLGPELTRETQMRLTKWCPVRCRFVISGSIPPQAMGGSARNLSRVATKEVCDSIGASTVLHARAAAMPPLALEEAAVSAAVARAVGDEAVSATESIEAQMARSELLGEEEAARVARAVEQGLCPLEGVPPLAVELARELVERVSEAHTPPAGWEAPLEGLVSRLRTILAMLPLAHGRPVKVEVFGSVGSGLGGPTSDVDLSVTPTSVEVARHWRAPEVVTQAVELLEEAGMADVQCRATARVPIVSFRDPDTGLHVDMCASNSLAIRNTRLVRAWCDTSPAFRPLALTLKHLAKRRRMAVASEKTIASYGWIVMLAAFLSKRHPHPALCSLLHLPPSWRVGGPLFSAPLDVPMVERVNADGVRYNSYFFDPNDELFQRSHPGAREAIRAACAPGSASPGGLLLGFLWEYGVAFDVNERVVTLRSPPPGGIAVTPGRSKEACAERVRSFNMDAGAVSAMELRPEDFVAREDAVKVDVRARGRKKELDGFIMPGFEEGRPPDPYAGHWDAAGYLRRAAVDEERGWMWGRATLEVEDPMETGYCVTHPLRVASWQAIRNELLRAYATIVAAGVEATVKGVAVGSAAWEELVERTHAHVFRASERSVLSSAAMVAKWERGESSTPSTRAVEAPTPVVAVASASTTAGDVTPLRRLPKRTVPGSLLPRIIAHPEAERALRKRHN